MTRCPHIKPEWKAQCVREIDHDPGICGPGHWYDRWEVMRNTLPPVSEADWDRAVELLTPFALSPEHRARLEFKLGSED